MEYLIIVNRVGTHHSYICYVYSIRSFVHLLEVVNWPYEVSAEGTADLSVSDLAVCTGNIFIYHCLRERFDVLWVFDRHKPIDGMLVVRLIKL